MKIRIREINDISFMGGKWCRTNYRYIVEYKRFLFWKGYRSERGQLLVFDCRLSAESYARGRVRELIETREGGNVSEERRTVWKYP